jgi:hypothetical protein
MLCQYNTKNLWIETRGPTRLKSRTLDSEIKPGIKKSREKSVNFEIRNQNFVIIEPTVYMTAVTHRNWVRNQEIRLEIKKSHYKSTEISLEINRNQVRNHVISKSCTLHVAVSDPSDWEGFDYVKNISKTLIVSNRPRQKAFIRNTDVLLVFFS